MKIDLEIYSAHGAANLKIGFIMRIAEKVLLSIFKLTIKSNVF